MHAPLLLVSALLLGAGPPPAGAPAGAPDPAGADATPALHPAPPPENLLAGPARCVLRYLDAVRIAGPRVATFRRGGPAPDVRAYGEARRLTAPRTLEEIDRWSARGEDHPLAPWRDAARSLVLESFQLLAARRAPLGAAVVTVRERFWIGDPDAPLDRTVSEYLVARVDGQWRVVDRRPGGTFDDSGIAEGYAGFFDAAGPNR
jgi:hypothetical protein